MKIEITQTKNTQKIDTDRAVVETGLDGLIKQSENQDYVDPVGHAEGIYDAAKKRRDNHLREELGLARRSGKEALSLLRVGGDIVPAEEFADSLDR